MWLITYSGQRSCAQNDKFFILFYLYIYSPDSLESDGGANT